MVQLPTLASALLAAGFAALAVPCVRRLTVPGDGGLAHPPRHEDAAELLLVVAMVAMFSPVGAPVPRAGWQAALGLGAAWYAVLTWRDFRSGRCWRGCAQHALSAAVMLYLISAMPGHHHDGPWLNMSTMDGPVVLPAVALTFAAYFAADTLVSATRALRASTAPRSRAACRSAMAAGMAYMLLTAAL